MRDLPLAILGRELELAQRLISESSIAPVLSAGVPPLLSGCSQQDLLSLYIQATQLGSPQRALCVALFLYARSQDQQQAGLLLLQACARAGRFQDLLELQSTLALDEPAALLLSLISHYRLGAWANVLDLAQQLPPDHLAFAQRRFIIRAALELGRFDQVDAWLQSLQPASAQEQKQAEVLHLLAALVRGEATAALLSQSLSLLPHLDQSEWACLLRFWPQLLLTAVSAEQLSFLQRWHYQAWRLLAEPRILAATPLCTPSRDGMRVGFLMQSALVEALALCEQLQRHWRTYHPAFELVPLVLNPDQSHQLDLQHHDLSHQTPIQRLNNLRSIQIDVLLDTVGPSDPNWLLTASQRVAPLQVAWFSVPAVLPGSSSYDGQIADRWTTPDVVSPDEMPWITLTGVRQVTAAPQRASAPASGSPPAAVHILVLGSPAQLLPGAAALLRRCLKECAVDALWFEDPCWRSPSLLEHWWRQWLAEDLPPQVQALPDWNVSDQHELRQPWIALDLCWSTPVQPMIRLLGQGCPVLSIASPLPSSTAAQSILAALGLESLRQSSPDSLLEAVQLLVGDHDVYGQITAHLRQIAATNLLTNIPLLAEDLATALLALRSQVTAAA